jgi:hypothetical protein
MGDVWLRTISNGLVRADKVTEIGCSRGSLHEEIGYSVKVVAGGKAHPLIDDSDFEGTMAERMEHARQMLDALLKAMDAAGNGGFSTVISHEPVSGRWTLTPSSELAPGVEVPGVEVPGA